MQEKLIVLPLVLAAWLGIVGARIWYFGSQDYAAQADAVIVLGAGIQADLPTPVFAERIRHGVNLYHAEFAPKVIFTGGFGEGQSSSESAVAAMFAKELGMSEADILIEERSRSTPQNLAEAYELMQQHDLDSAIIVSDPLHMQRSLVIAQNLGIKSVSSPTPTSRYRSLRTQLGFLAREIYFLHHYFFTGR